MPNNKELRYSEFSTIDSVVSSVLQNPHLQKGLKKASVFKFWAKTVGKKFEKYSRAEALSLNNVLTVACANAAVSSELLMYKNELLEKINKYSMPLGIEIKDINFSHKIWKQNTTETAQLQQNTRNPYKKDLTGFNPDDIELNADEVEAIRKSVFANDFATEKQREKMFNAIILDLKIQKFVKKEI